MCRFVCGHIEVQRNMNWVGARIILIILIIYRIIFRQYRLDDRPITASLFDVAEYSDKYV